MSPLQQMFATIIAQDETDRAIDFAQLSARAEQASYRREAYDWAMQCLNASDGWDLESLSFNIESNFPDLADDEWYDIAETALKAATE